jgi:DNA-binding response OmpR family regulator
MGLAEGNNNNAIAQPDRVLIADDDATTRILLRAAMSQWGYEIVEAADGEEAWKILQQPDAPKLMIVDWLMPKLDGIDLCRRIKNELKQYPYIILLTQLSGTTNIVKGLEAGANEFLSKPFNMAELQSRLAVGRRILQYEECLSKQQIELKSCLAETTELFGILNEMINKVETIITDAEKSTGNLQLSQLKEIQTEIKKTMSRMAELRSEHNTTSG